MPTVVVEAVKGSHVWARELAWLKRLTPINLMGTNTSAALMLCRVVTVI